MGLCIILKWNIKCTECSLIRLKCRKMQHWGIVQYSTVRYCTVRRYICIMKFLLFKLVYYTHVVFESIFPSLSFLCFFAFIFILKWIRVHVCMCVCDSIISVIHFQNKTKIKHNRCVEFRDPRSSPHPPSTPSGGFGPALNADSFKYNFQIETCLFTSAFANWKSKHISYTWYLICADVCISVFALWKFYAPVAEGPRGAVPGSAIQCKFDL